MGEAELRAGRRTEAMESIRSRPGEFAHQYDPASRVFLGRHANQVAKAAGIMTLK
jgi:hypothetical protein